MEPCIEIDPSKFVVVVGPRFTSSLISEFVVDDATSRGPPIFAFKEIVNRGIELLLQAESFSSEGDRAKREMLFRNAYELDPTFALRKVADSLKKLGRYSDWLDHLFKRDVGTPAMSRIPGLLRLLDLQRKGALLVYAHCDDILNRLAGLEPILPERKDHASKWSSGEMTGFLHIHGVYSEPDTVKLDCEVLYGNVASEHIRLAFEQRDVVALGLDEHHDDPLLSRFWEKHITPRPAVRQTFFLSSLPPSTVVPPAPSDCLPLALPHPSGYVAGFSDAVCDTAETSWSLWRQIDLPGNSDLADPQAHTMMGLLVAGQRGAGEISKMMLRAPGVNFALVSSVTCAGQYIHTVSIRVGISQVSQLWNWVFVEENSTLISLGLLCIVMPSGTFVWLRGKPFTGGGVTSSTESVGGSSPVTPASTTRTPPPLIRHTDSDIAMETDLTTDLTDGKSVQPSTFPPLASSPAQLSPPSSTMQREPSCSPRPRKIPRYTVHKFSLNKPNVSPLVKRKGLQAFADDSHVLPANTLSRSVFARRGSLPPMKAEPRPDPSSALNQLAESLQNPIGGEMPSYVAIKQALLQDTYRRRSSIQADPKVLKNLLQTKFKFPPLVESRETLLSQRRNSDPGGSLEQRDFERRKELFIDDNLAWSSNFGTVIERKVAKWERQRSERRQREAYRQQQMLGTVGEFGAGNRFQFVAPTLNHAATGLVRIVQSDGTVKTTGALSGGTGATTTLLQPSFFGEASGVGPIMFPQPVLPSSTPSSSPASSAGVTPMFYAPYNISPYTFVNPYSAQPTAYYLPQASPAGAAQKVLYYVPPVSTATSSAALSFLPSMTSVPGAGSVGPTPSSSSVMPNLASLIAPAATVLSPPRHAHPPNAPSTTVLIQKNHAHHAPRSPSRSGPETGSEAAGVSPRKRSRVFPEQLSALLQHNNVGGEPESPPSGKKPHRLSDSSAVQIPMPMPTLIHVAAPPHGPSHHNQVPMQPSSPLFVTQVVSPPHSVHTGRSPSLLESHLLRQSPTATSPRCHSDSSGSQEMDDTEVLETVGGSPPNVGGQLPAPRSQLQLWQFLLELLFLKSNSHLIHWTDEDLEFTISNPHEVANLWGQFTNNPSMSYDKLARGMRYYYSKGIMSKVAGRKLTFRYMADHVRSHITMRQLEAMRKNTTEETSEDIVVE